MVWNLFGKRVFLSALKLGPEVNEVPELKTMSEHLKDFKTEVRIHLSDRNFVLAYNAETSVFHIESTEVAEDEIMDVLFSLVLMYFRKKRVVVPVKESDENG